MNPEKEMFGGSYVEYKKSDRLKDFIFNR